MPGHCVCGHKFAIRLAGRQRNLVVPIFQLSWECVLLLCQVSHILVYLAGQLSQSWSLEHGRTFLVANGAEGYWSMHYFRSLFLISLRNGWWYFSEWKRLSILF